MKTELWMKQNAEYLKEQKGQRLFLIIIIIINQVHHIFISHLSLSESSDQIFHCLFVFPEKEERIKKEKEQGTYKEKVSVFVKNRVSQAGAQGPS